MKCLFKRQSEVSIPIPYSTHGFQDRFRSRPDYFGIALSLGNAPSYSQIRRFIVYPISLMVYDRIKRKAEHSKLKPNGSHDLAGQFRASRIYFTNNSDNFAHTIKKYKEVLVWQLHTNQLFQLVFSIFQ